MDKSSLKILWGTVVVAIACGVYIGITPIGHINGVGYTPSIIGLTIIIVGSALRWVAIFTLRRYFTVNVAIAGDQIIIDRGLYKYVRHPAYMGSLLSFLGLGLSFSNWISLIVIFLPILAAFIYRIRIEEAALVQAFGDKYIEYSWHTKRLLPGLY